MSIEETAQVAKVDTKLRKWKMDTAKPVRQRVPEIVVILQTMKIRMTKTEARAFKRRWAVVNAAEREELRITPPVKKLRQLAALMASAKMLRWNEQLASEEVEVRERWNVLRKIYKH